MSHRPTVTKSAANIKEIITCFKEVKTRVKRIQALISEFNLSGLDSINAVYDECNYLENECYARLLTAFKGRVKS